MKLFSFNSLWSLLVVEGTRNIYNNSLIDDSTQECRHRLRTFVSKIIDEYLTLAKSISSGSS